MTDWSDRPQADFGYCARIQCLGNTPTGGCTVAAYYIPSFSKKGIDLAPLEIEKGADGLTYFCTPRGARIIGWAGVDGIHYCFIRGFGEMVFSVSPMNLAPHYVHPLASDFSDFLRLLLACGNSAALEQAWQWDREQFETFLRENPATKEQRAVLAQITEQMGLGPMENPWQYLRELQDSFDFLKSNIRRTSTIRI